MLKRLELGGARENFRANKFTKDANKSKIESVKDAKITVDALMIQTVNLIKINSTAVQTEAAPANKTSFL